MPSTPDFISMLQTLNQSLPWVERLILASAYIAGLGLITTALFKLKIYGEARTMMSSQSDIRGPLVMIACGTALIYFPSMYEITLNTFFGYDNPLAYDEDTSNRWSVLISVVVFMIQIVGFIAFTRGWLLLSKLGERGQPGQGPKAFTHIIGGIAAINIVGVTKIFNATLGLS